MRVADSEVLIPEPASPAVVDSAGPGLRITAIVALKGEGIRDGGVAWVSCNGVAFCTSFTGLITPIAERAVARFGLEGAGRRALTRAIGTAWRAAVEEHTAARLARINAETASWRVRFRASLDLASGAAAP